MERRIRIIYIMSLFLALTAIGLQGYWLYNQYRYETEQFAEELGKKVLAVSQEEFRIRKNAAFGKEISYVIDRSTEVSSKDSVYQKKSFAGLRFQINELSDPSPVDSQQVTNLHLSFDPTIPEDSIVHGVERSVVNHFRPFSIALLDSVLHATLPHYEMELLPPLEGDTVSRYSSSVLLSGNLFQPLLCVTYRYAPLEKSGIRIMVPIPVNPLLMKMGGQLCASLFLVLLLLACLAFLIKTILKQKKIGEMREGFVHTMIHELRRPVQTLKMCISFLKDEKMRTDEAASGEVVRDAMFELDNLSAYLGKLKDMVSADGGATLLHPVAFDLRELVDKVIRLTQFPSEKKVSFSTAFPPDLTKMTADPVHIANVLSNLIENAIKYSGPEVEIRVVVISGAKGVELTVSDTGFGISPEEQSRVFEKFYRSAYLPDKQIPGLGLGLSYVRQITEAHQGHVTLHSEMGTGTTVTVVMPQ